jgi:hypothetical protein
MNPETDTQDLSARVEKLERDQQTLMKGFEAFATAVKNAVTAIMETQTNHTQALSQIRARLSAFDAGNGGNGRAPEDLDKGA